MKIAFVYDWMDSWGGVERVLLALAEMFPKAHWYTSAFDEKRASWAKNLNPQTSFIQKLPLIKNSRFLSTPLYPFAFEAFDFSSYDLVISITSSFAKGIITRPPTKHICYLLTPTRFLWSQEKDYKTPSFLNPYKSYLKRWDKMAANRPDKIISISKTVQKRVKEIYGRDSEVIYPPFDDQYWSKITAVIPAKAGIQRKDLDPRSGSGMTNKMLNQVQHDKKAHPSYSILNTSYYLIVSRLEPYKKVDLVVETFKHLSNQNLVIVGTGSQLNKLRQNASKNITFFQNITDISLSHLYENAKALIMPQEEDFGLVSLEAQFFACPIIAYKKGGATETVMIGKTGKFFDKQTINSLTSALDKFDSEAYNLKQSTVKSGHTNIEKFSKEKFMEKFKNYLDQYATQ